MTHARTPWTPGPYIAGDDSANTMRMSVWRDGFAGSSAEIARGIRTSADARLLAAAPEMADFLMEIAQFCEMSDREPWMKEAAQDARALLARITSPST